MRRRKINGGTATARKRPTFGIARAAALVAFGFACNLMMISSMLDQSESTGDDLVEPRTLVVHATNSTHDDTARHLRDGNTSKIRIHPKQALSVAAPAKGSATADVQQIIHHPPRKMSSTKFPIYFVHVGKTGGSSVNGMLASMGSGGKFGGKVFYRKGQNHIDWSWLQQQRYKENKQNASAVTRWEDFDVSSNTDVVTWFRHPVERAVSQFYYAKTQGWVKNRRKKGMNVKWSEQSIDEYMMNDTERVFTQPLSDGEGGVRWLTGCWKEGTGWVSTTRDSDTKRYLRRNKTAAILLAAKRLESTVWFGLLEQQERSLKLLQLTLDLKQPPTISHSNPTKKKDKASNLTKERIAPYLPQDIWLYEYARRLFEARWLFLAENQTYVHPELPPLPEFSNDSSESE